MSLETTRTSAYSWHEAKRRAEEQKYGTKIEVPKNFVGSVPPEFEPSPPPFSIKKGANVVYRDQRSRDSFQIREFDDHYTIEMDRHNPEHGNAIAHTVYDAPEYTFGALAVLGAAYFG